MADLPVTSDEGATPVVINDPVTTANVASVVSAGVSGGAIVTSTIGGYKASYSVAVLGLVVATTPTDVFTIAGSATKTVRITYISVSGTENNATVRDIQLLKRTTANSGGTSTTPEIVEHDSNSAEATAVVTAYTANPSLGVLEGVIRSGKLSIPATNLTGAADRLVWTFGDRPSQVLVLRGISETVAVNLNGVTMSTPSFNLVIEWTEE
jgi:hypothetical protein